MYDPLFLALAQAKSQPSHGYRAFQAGVDAITSPIEGYEKGLELRNKISALKSEPELAMAQKRSALLDNYGKLSEQIGPDKAISLMGPSLQSAGIDMDSLAPSTTSQYSPEELMTKGKWGQNQLGMMNTVDEMKKRSMDLENESPYTPEQTRAILSGNKNLAEALINANPSGSIPYRQVTNAISTIKPNQMGGYFNSKEAQINLQMLPSQMGPNTAPGAAYQVKVAARQGKSLIAKPGSYQRLGLSQGDAARAVLRNSPTDEAMRNANFSDTLINQYNKVKQKINSDPTSIDQPLIRKELYDIFDEMDKSATPFIANQLANRESFGLPTPGEVKKRELGENLSDIPFDSGVSAPNPNIQSGIPKPRTVSQGNYTYTLNDQTGQYE